MTNERHDIAVIGAGIAGVSTALHLLMQGRKVLLIDRSGAGKETSYGNAGVIGNGYVLPFGFPDWKRIPAILLDRDTAARIDYRSLPRLLPWLVDFFFQSLPGPRCENGKLLYPLVANCIAEHRALMRGTDAERYLSLKGRIALYRSASSFAESALERAAAHEMNAPFEILDVTACRAIEPHLKPAFHKAVHWPGSAHFRNPGAVTAAYAARFVHEGGVLLQTEVRGMKSGADGTWVIETPQGDIAARYMVICGGPWSAEMLKPLGYRFPMAIKRGYHQHYPAIGDATLSHSFADADWGYVLAPMEQGYRLTTGAEFAGLDSPPTPIQISRALLRARELFPLGEPIEPNPWLGNRPCFADSLPVIGPAPRHTGLWLNFGHGHLGMTIGPASGRLLAEMMGGKQPFCDPHPYRAERFSC
jgi:D-amino-acid dehydrogenase